MCCSPLIQSRYHQGTWLQKINVDTTETESAHFWSDVGPHPGGNVEFVDVSSQAVIRASTIAICQVKYLFLRRKDTLVGERPSGLARNSSP